MKKPAYKGPEQFFTDAPEVMVWLFLREQLLELTLAIDTLETGKEETTETKVLQTQVQFECLKSWMSHLDRFALLPIQSSAHWKWYNWWEDTMAPFLLNPNFSYELTTHHVQTGKIPEGIPVKSGDWTDWRSDSPLEKYLDFTSKLWSPKNQKIQHAKRRVSKKCSSDGIDPKHSGNISD